MIDSAVRFRDPRLAGRVVNRLECPNGIDHCANGRDDDGNGRVDDIVGWNFLTRSPDVDRERFPNASGGHGTRVASVISAPRSGETWGANPWVDVIPVVVAERRAADAGNEVVASSDDVFDALCYLLDLRQRGLDLVAINVSMGYCGWEASPCDNDRLAQITDALAEEGVLIVAASANKGGQCPRGGSRSACSNHDECPWYPASFDRRNVLGVTEVGAAGGMCSGGSLSLRCPGHGLSIELMGPGSNVPTLGFDGSTARASGTSFAAPIVTAIAALVSASLPDRPSAEALRLRLVRSVNPPTNPNDASRTCSGGMINAPRAIAGEGDAGAQCNVR